MPDPNQLPYMIRLLDDESEIVRENVTKELAAFGDSLHEELDKLKITPSPEQLKLLRALLAEHSRRWLKDHWEEWKHVDDDKLKLEHALGLIGDYLGERTGGETIPGLLDQLMHEYRQNTLTQDPLTLASYLFRSRALKGAKEDYLNPRNSDLAYVITEGHGMPISLVSVYILVGKRLGFDIEGINFPGHFLARAVWEGRTYIVDCFHGGLTLDEQALANLIPKEPISMDKILALQCQAEAIVARVLRNLMNAYRHQNHPETAHFMSDLLQTLSSENRDE